MIETLQTHRAMLEKMRVTTRDIDQERLPVGARLTLQIYIMILTDGLSVLGSLIDHLAPLQSGHDNSNRPHEADQ